MAALLDHLGIEKADIVGNSMGGFVAASFARQYPDRTRSVGLIDTAGVTSPHPSDMQRMLDRGRNLFLFTDPARFTDFYAMTMAKSPYVPGFVKDAMAQDYAEREPELAEIYDALSSAPFLTMALATSRRRPW